MVSGRSVGFEDELDRRSAWACPRFKVHGPVVDHVINGGARFRNPDLPYGYSFGVGAIDRLRSMRQANLHFRPSRPPGSNDRVPEERSKKSNHNNAKDKAPRVATKGRVIVGSQPVGIAHAKLLGRPPASQPPRH
jgi:hypothetical protein